MTLTPPTTSPSGVRVKQAKTYTVEKVMLLFTAFFVTGIILYSVLSGPIRDAVVGLLSCGVAYVLLKPPKKRRA